MCQNNAKGLKGVAVSELVIAPDVIEKADFMTVKRIADGGLDSNNERVEVLNRSVFS
jgi:hypothetical protein